MRITAEATESSNPAASAQQHAKLLDAAQQFEAMLLQEMLKPMQSKQSWDSDEGDKSGGDGDTLSSYGTEAVARAIAKGGGLGIAKQVVQKVWHEKTKSS
jgi:peptidoglycan hydrolase FlgJ